MGSILNLRNFVGALLFMVLVGEFQIGGVDKTFTPFGIVLYVMYFLIFLLFEAVTTKYKLANYQIFLLGFVFYAVFVTGFVHAEIANYVLQPSNILITTIIRIQSSMYMFYAYMLLNRFMPRKESNKPVSVRTGLILFALYVLILTPSKSYGLIAILTTIITAPIESLFFAILGIVALRYGLRKVNTVTVYRNDKLVYASAILFLIALIPAVVLVLPYYLLMIIVSIVLLLNKKFRDGALLT